MTASDQGVCEPAPFALHRRELVEEPQRPVVDGGCGQRGREGLRRFSDALGNARITLQEFRNPCRIQSIGERSLGE